jgi:uracil-DNA glycosylase
MTVDRLGVPSVSFQNLMADIRAEALRESFPVDKLAYPSGVDWMEPILSVGNLASNLCILGRDLGAKEVEVRQPLCGPSGDRVRQGIRQFLVAQRNCVFVDLDSVLDEVLLTNTMPYKPLLNKTFPAMVRTRFRPFIERLLVMHWKGSQIITLGNEALDWFYPYAPEGQRCLFSRQADRYSASFRVTLTASDEKGKTHDRTLTLRPLPHPSPRNFRYRSQFPKMLQDRLVESFGLK